MTKLEKSSPSGIGRRTLVKGAAWSVPVVATGVAAPRAAASTAPQFGIVFINYIKTTDILVLSDRSTVVSNGLVTLPTKFQVFGYSPQYADAIVAIDIHRPAETLPSGQEGYGFGVNTFTIPFDPPDEEDARGWNMPEYSAGTGYPEVTWSTGNTTLGQLAGWAPGLSFPITFGLFGQSSNVQNASDVTFQVEIFAFFPKDFSRSASNGTNIVVPANAGIL